MKTLLLLTVLSGALAAAQSNQQPRLFSPSVRLAEPGFFQQQSAALTAARHSNQQLHQVATLTHPDLRQKDRQIDSQEVVDAAFRQPLGHTSTQRLLMQLDSLRFLNADTHKSRSEDDSHRLSSQEFHRSNSHFNHRFSSQPDSTEVTDQDGQPALPLAHFSVANSFVRVASPHATPAQGSHKARASFQGNTFQQSAARQSQVQNNRLQASNFGSQVQSAKARQQTVSSQLNTASPVQAVSGSQRFGSILNARPQQSSKHFQTISAPHKTMVDLDDDIDSSLDDPESQQHLHVLGSLVNQQLQRTQQAQQGRTRLNQQQQLRPTKVQQSATLPRPALQQSSRQLASVSQQSSTPQAQQQSQRVQPQPAVVLSGAAPQTSHRFNVRSQKNQTSQTQQQPQLIATPQPHPVTKAAPLQTTQQTVVNKKSATSLVSGIAQKSAAAARTAELSAGVPLALAGPQRLQSRTSPVASKQPTLQQPQQTVVAQQATQQSVRTQLHSNASQQKFGSSATASAQKRAPAVTAQQHQQAVAPQQAPQHNVQPQLQSVASQQTFVAPAIQQQRLQTTVVQQAPQQKQQQVFVAVDEDKLADAFEPLNLPSGAGLMLGTVTSSFTCADRPYGYYADQDNQCRVYYVCNPSLFSDGSIHTTQYSFMCGEGTVFDQRELSCVSVSEATPCRHAANFFSRNDEFGFIENPVSEFLD